MIRELIFDNKEDIKIVNDFLSNNEYSEYTQSVQWNQVRNEKKKFYLYSIKDDKIIWVCNLLEKEKNTEKYLYAPRGPVLNYNDINVLDVFFMEINKWMKENGYKKLTINPCISWNIFEKFPSKYNYNIAKKDDYSNLLDSCKLAIMKIIFDEEKLIMKLTNKARQNTRRSYRKKLKSRCSKEVDIENFYKLYLETSTRHDFKPHDIEYFKKLVKIYEDNIIFLEVWYEDVPLAMSIDIIYNGKLIYLYGVSSTQNRNLLGMYNLQWEAVKYCIRNKIQWYDFGGVFCQENEYNNKDYGLYNFKKAYCYDGFYDIVPDITIDFSEEE